MQQSQLTKEQQQANEQLMQQLQRIPVLSKQIQILERQNAQQRGEMAEILAVNDQLQQEIQRMQQEAAQPQPEFEEVQQDENSES